ncbi:MAG TPA: 4-hydroxythreonine-4-phosphate dehydrogenase, partial [Thiotrichales bacterium]|nr:4-hydroxythreonine-4-phosphate dehydrogenase [Thiotrichales bacterium]
MTTSLVITAGEPAGIGPDICIDLLGKPDNVRRIGAADDTRLYIIADPQLLAELAALLQKKIQITLHETFPDSPASYRPGQLNVIPVSMASRCRPGQLDRANSPYVLACLDRAAELCINRQVDAMVTGPVQKSIINDAGIRFTGHTEYLADKVNATPVMMLATDSLRVALATTHLP